MLSWVVSSLPHPVYQAYVCSSGLKGYNSLLRSLEPAYPQHTIRLTNGDVIKELSSSNEVENYDADDEGE